MNGPYRESLQYIPRVAPELLTELAGQSEFTKEQWGLEFTGEQLELAKLCLPMTKDIRDSPEGGRARAHELSVAYQALCLTVERAPEDMVALPSIPVVTDIDRHVWNMKRNSRDIRPITGLCRALALCQPHLVRRLDAYIEDSSLSPALRTTIIAPTAIMYNALERQMSIDALTMQLGDIARWPTI